MRVLTTTKILAVAVSAGCAPKGALDIARPPVAAVASATSVASVASGVSVVAAPAALPEALVRPLADPAGYPLVGNLVRKGPAEEQPSESPQGLRAQASR